MRVSQGSSYESRTGGLTSRRLLRWEVTVAEGGFPAGSSSLALTITSLPEPEGETTRITIVMLLSPEWARYPA